ncbi:hypothetical protein [Nonlabens xiamenensis]|uniref:hypothetical protein n=1 Tax=Nonlabens xiamenensis TaxID=2341043 RepID=UPI000F60D297|nr:hypothetical protein [Nonlabens xiamenensis]
MEFKLLDLSDTVQFPEIFPSPFQKNPIELAQRAALDLQAYLKTQQDWKHDFGIRTPTSPGAMGKMFGVLVVKDHQNRLGYLSAFSGQLQDRTSHQPPFVPPVFGELKDVDYCTSEYEAFSSMNRKIKALENSSELLQLEKQVNEQREIHQQLLSTQKLKHRQQKQLRRKRLACLPPDKSNKAFKQMEAAHLQAELNEKFMLKEYEIYLGGKIEDSLNALGALQEQIQLLKKQRQQRSRKLGEWIFDHYDFLNSQGAVKNVRQLFSETPPAAAGDCAAPKLLQFAYKNGYQPIAMAEFWWGKTNKLGDKKHGEFYPACEAKCRPILEFMLS